MRLKEKEYENLKAPKVGCISMSQFIRDKLFLDALHQCPANLFINTLNDMTTEFSKIGEEQDKILQILGSAKDDDLLNDSDLDGI